MNYKKIIIGIGAIGSMTSGYYIGKNNGYNQGYSQGFEDTKTEIRKYIVNLKQDILRKEEDASKVEWNWTDTTKMYTYGDTYRSEKNAFNDCYLKIDDLIDYRIDKLNKKDLIETVQFNKKYDK